MSVLSAIPTIDFAPFLVDEGCVAGGSPTASQRRVANEIDTAMRDCGFLYVTGLGISDDDVRSVFGLARDLFERPDEQKAAEMHIKTLTGAGYAPMRSEAINPGRVPDLHDGFLVQSLSHHDQDFRGTPAGFKEVVSAFWEKAEQAARRFNIACALALGLPTSELDFFTKVLERADMSVLRLNHYPPCDFVPGDTDGASAGGAIRTGEHTDFGLFTFLFLDGEAPGLQVKKAREGGALKVVPDGKGAWLDAPGRGGSVAIVNSGALLAQLTNDRWQATAHRVVVPDAEQAAVHRYPLPYFTFPDSGALIQAHPSFVPEGEEPHYAPTTAEDYFRMRFQAIQTGPAGAAPQRGGA